MKLRTRPADTLGKSRRPLGKSIAPKPIDLTTHLYEVEKIFKKRWGGLGWEYFVRWAGYPSSDDSWIKECPPYFKKKWEINKSATAPDTSNLDLLAEVACKEGN